MNKENKRTLDYLYKFLCKLPDDDIAVVFEGITQALEFIAKDKFPEEWKKFKESHYEN